MVSKRGIELRMIRFLEIALRIVTNGSLTVEGRIIDLLPNRSYGGADP